MRIFNKNITYQKSDPAPKNSLFHRRSLIWIGAAISCLLIQGLFPVLVWEQGYYRGLFRLLRVAYDYTLGWLPFPMVYIVLGVMGYRSVVWLSEMKRGIVYQSSRAIGGIASVVTLFYLLWGFNYGQNDFPGRIGLESMTMSPAEMEAEFASSTRALHQIAQELPDGLTGDEALKDYPVTDHKLRKEVESALALLDMPVTGRVRVRQLWPSGLLMRWSTAGIYIPHTGEGHIDKGLLSVQKPFTIAHEMSHGYGVTDEGACNFIAWLACHHSDDPWVRFSGAMSYWRFTASAMPDSIVISAIESLPPVVTRSIQLVRENNRKYPDILPQIRNAIYSSYLKSHGVTSGLRSYHEVVIMVHHYLKSNQVRGRSE